MWRITSANRSNLRTNKNIAKYENIDIRNLTNIGNRLDTDTNRIWLWI